MPEYAIVTDSSESNVASENMRVISFRPGQPGPVGIRSSPVALTSKPQSETGLLGILELLRPGDTVPVASVKVPISSTLLALSYTATSTDLTTKWEWTCRVYNQTLVEILFDTDITYVSDFPVQTASFDIPLLNILFAEVANDAQFKVHIQTSGAEPSSNDPLYNASYLTFSPDLATAIKLPSQYNFHVDDFSLLLTNELLKVLSVPGLPPALVFRGTVDAGPIPPPYLDPLTLTLGVTVDLSTLVATCINFVSVTIELKTLSIGINVGFDGVIQATYRGSLYVSGIHVTEVSGAVTSAQPSGGMLTQASVQSYIQFFFTNLLRLNDSWPPTTNLSADYYANGMIQGYGAKGNSLVVQYYSLPVKKTVTTQSEEEGA